MKLRPVFDFGAVVFHWQPTRMLMRELPRLAPDAAQAAHWAAQIFQGYGGDWGAFDRGLLGVPELVDRIVQRTGLRATDVQTVVDGVVRELQPQADTVALLLRLRAAGRTLHYLSNMPAPIAAVLLQRNPFLACFDSGVFSSSVELGKPDPALFQLAAARFRADPAELLLIDDQPLNVQAARAEGWDAFVFTDAAQAETELRQRGLL